jgi:molybdate transport system regulatory protein
MTNPSAKIVKQSQGQSSSFKSPLEALKPRLRIVFGDALRLGPGKIDLLEAIDRTGSISGAGRDLGMSYRRAWLLIDEVNHMFRTPVIVASAGGSQGGGAKLTDFGRSIILAFRRIESRTQAVIHEELARFEGDLVDHANNPE